MRAILIDDETHAVENLQIILNDFCKGVEVVGTANDIPTGARLINSCEPDIVFLDVSMPGGTGFDVLASVDYLNFKVVFVTAYEQYAIEAIRHNAFDYLMKPIQISELKQCVDKIKQESKTNPTKSNLRLKLHTSDSIEFVNIEDIMYCKSDNAYCEIYTKSGRKLTFTKKMKDLESQLPENLFIRCHNSHIINKTFVVKYNKADGGSIVLDNNIHIPLARARKDKVLEWLEY